MRPINVVGDLNIDLILSGLEDEFGLGREVIASRRDVSVGGSAANVASLLAAHGCPVRLFAQVGGDSEGKSIIETLSARGLPVDTISISREDRTGITVSISYPHDRAYITFPGTVGSTTLEDLNDGYLQAQGHLHLASIFLQKSLRASIGTLLERAKALGMTTSLDPGGDPDGNWDISDLKAYFRYLDWFLPNADELCAISATHDLDAALDSVPDTVSIVVKAGSDGAVLRYQGEILRFPAVPTSAAVVDTTCAGDCFDAGLLLGLMQGQSVSEAVNLGNQLGADSVTCVGLPGVVGWIHGI